MRSDSRLVGVPTEARYVATAFAPKPLKTPSAPAAPCSRSPRRPRSSRARGTRRRRPAASRTSPERVVDGGGGIETSWGVPNNFLALLKQTTTYYTKTHVRTCSGNNVMTPFRSPKPRMFRYPPISSSGNSSSSHLVEIFSVIPPCMLYYII